MVVPVPEPQSRTSGLTATYMLPLSYGAPQADRAPEVSPIQVILPLKLEPLRVDEDESVLEDEAAEATAASAVVGVATTSSVVVGVSATSVVLAVGSTTGVSDVVVGAGAT